MQIKLDSIKKTFGTLTALESVSAVFERGNIYIFVGPNGAGKTTLLRIIAGLMPPTSGRVVFESDTSKLGVMMQETYLYRDLTPRENLELYAKLYGAPAGRITDVCAILELQNFIDHDVATLSHGQRQRVSLARALLPKPDILVLDEPFLGLDTASIGHVGNFLSEFKSDGGLALIATHEMGIVRSFADNLLLLDGGKIEYFGRFNA